MVITMVTAKKAGAVSDNKMLFLLLTRNWSKQPTKSNAMTGGFKI